MNIKNIAGIQTSLVLNELKIESFGGIPHVAVNTKHNNQYAIGWMMKVIWDAAPEWQDEPEVDASKFDTQANNSLPVDNSKPLRRKASRRDRFDHALGYVSDARNTMEELRDELQNWLDNMPENLQNGSKADELNEAISALDDVVNGLEDVEGQDVTFPGMR